MPHAGLRALRGLRRGEALRAAPHLGVRGQHPRLGRRRLWGPDPHHPPLGVARHRMDLGIRRRQPIGHRPLQGHPSERRHRLDVGWRRRRRPRLPRLAARLARCSGRSCRLRSGRRHEKPCVHADAPSLEHAVRLGAQPDLVVARTQRRRRAGRHGPRAAVRIYVAVPVQPAGRSGQRPIPVVLIHNELEVAAYKNSACS
mmetsp:Transcript_91286/g.263421  ORF Transcript_91286/g.263421 Transcript_91286/m.263421 type:complete len:200 (-) Transcript_91286:85-684(-)